MATTPTTTDRWKVLQAGGYTGGLQRAGGLPNVVLATYRELQQAGAASQRSLRSSIWIRESGGWRLTFHQGTPITG